MPGQRKRCFMVTIWPKDDDEGSVLTNVILDNDVPRILKDDGNLKYVLISAEVGSHGVHGNGFHFHMFIRYGNARSTSLNSMKRGLDRHFEMDTNHWHIEPAIAPDEAVDYVKKDGCWTEWGEYAQGARKDQEEYWRWVKENIGVKTELEIAEEDLGRWARNYKALDKYRSLLISSQVTSRQPRTVVWLYGRSGTGKSHRMLNMLEEAGAWTIISPGNPPWFDTVTPLTEAVGMDEMDGNLPLALLLRILDPYPVVVPVKGGFVQWRPSLVVLTSNLPPWEVYSPEQLSKHDMGLALKRRIGTITECVSQTSEVEKSWPGGVAP